MKKIFILAVIATLLLAGSAFAMQASPPDVFGIDYNLLMQQATINNIASIAAIRTTATTVSPPTQTTPANIYLIDCTDVNDTYTTAVAIQRIHRLAENDDFVFAIWTSIGSPPRLQAVTANFNYTMNLFDNAPATTRNGPLKVSQRGAVATIATADPLNSTTLDFNSFLVAEKNDPTPRFG